jgi:hypothetical protein
MEKLGLKGSRCSMRLLDGRRRINREMRVRATVEQGGSGYAQAGLTTAPVIDDRPAGVRSMRRGGRHAIHAGEILRCWLESVSWPG